MSPVNVNAIGAYIREQREQAKVSMRQLAQAAGVSNPYLSQVERGLRKPSADILQQIAKGLRISAEALYVQAGILDDRPGETTVTDAIMADTEITERQKQMLVDIYESFRREVRAEGHAPGSGSGAAVDEGVAAADAEPGDDPAIEAVAAAEAERWAVAPVPPGSPGPPAAPADTSANR